MEARKELPKTQLQAIRALTALQVYGQLAPVGPLWPRWSESGSVLEVGPFADYAGLTPLEAGKALDGLKEKGLVSFAGASEGRSAGPLGVTVQGTLAGQTGTFA